MKREIEDLDELNKSVEEIYNYITQVMNYKLSTTIVLLEYVSAKVIKENLPDINKGLEIFSRQLSLILNED